MPQTRSALYRVYLAIAAGGVLVAMQACTQDQSVSQDEPVAQHEPYRLVENWAQLPDGLIWGQAIAVETDADGNHVESSY